MAFGPTFYSELVAAGLGEAGLRWHSNGTVIGRDELSPAQQATLDAVIAAHNAAHAHLKAYAAAMRWAKETGGVVFGGVPIPTDERTQMVLSGAYARAKGDPSYSIPNWKLESGAYTSLSNAQIIAIAEAVADHIQACFDLNAQADDGIEAGTITTEAEIDALFA